MTRTSLDYSASLYLQGHSPSDPLASPLFGEMSRLPPMLVQVGSGERLLSDSLRLAAKADAAGVDVELEVFDRCNHLWHRWVPDSPEANAAVSRVAQFVHQHTTATQ